SLRESRRIILAAVQEISRRPNAPCVRLRRLPVDPGSQASPQNHRARPQKAPFGQTGGKALKSAFPMLPCVIFEDEHLLVVNKPAGLNTHSPSPYASEGIYDWLRHREPRWADLAIIHRLDKETSGVIVFSK